MPDNPMNYGMVARDDNLLPYGTRIGGRIGDARDGEFVDSPSTSRVLTSRRHLPRPSVLARAAE
jgi:hypothetical protein